MRHKLWDSLIATLLMVGIWALGAIIIRIFFPYDDVISGTVQFAGQTWATAIVVSDALWTAFLIVFLATVIRGVWQGKRLREAMR